MMRLAAAGVTGAHAFSAAAAAAAVAAAVAAAAFRRASALVIFLHVAHIFSDVWHGLSTTRCNPP